MALTYGEPFKTSVGGRYLTGTTVTLDTKYPTGGYTLDGTKLGLVDGNIDLAWANGPAIPTGGATGFVAKVAGGKLQLYRAAGANEALAELPNNTDVHTSSVQVLAVGY